jgi:hypothetical protein
MAKSKKTAVDDNGWSERLGAHVRSIGLITVNLVFTEGLSHQVRLDWWNGDAWFDRYEIKATSLEQAKMLALLLAHEEMHAIVDEIKHTAHAVHSAQADAAREYLEAEKARGK